MHFPCQVARRVCRSGRFPAFPRRRLADVVTLVYDQVFHRIGERRQKRQNGLADVLEETSN